MSLLTHQSHINPTTYFWDANSGITLLYSVSGLTGVDAGNIVSQTLTAPSDGRLLVFAVANFINPGSTSRTATASVNISGTSSGVGAVTLPAISASSKNLNVSGGYYVTSGTSYLVNFNFAGNLNYSGGGLMVLFVPN